MLRSPPARRLPFPKACAAVRSSSVVASSTAAGRGQTSCRLPLSSPALRPAHRIRAASPLWLPFRALSTATDFVHVPLIDALPTETEERGAPPAQVVEDAAVDSRNAPEPAAPSSHAERLRAQAERWFTEAGAAGNSAPPVPSLPSKAGQQSFVSSLLAMCESREEAQFRMEAWAQDLYRISEEARREHRDSNKQTSPEAYRALSTRAQFTTAAWEWTQKLEAHLEKNGLAGFSATTQKFLNQSRHGHQIFSNSDIARIIVSQLMERLASVCSKPFFGTTKGVKGFVPVQSNLDAAYKTIRYNLDGKDDPNRETWFRRPLDVRLLTVAVDLGNAFTRELAFRFSDSNAVRNPFRRLKPEQLKDAAELGLVTLDSTETVRLGGDLLYLSQMVELDCLGPEPAPPWTKARVKYDTARTKVVGMKLAAVVRFHPTLLKLSSIINEPRLGHRDLPTLIEPLPVTRTDDGGYVTLPKSFLSARPSQARTRILAEARESGQMDSVLEAINYLSGTAWRTNETILNDLEKLWPDTTVPPTYRRRPAVCDILNKVLRPQDKPVLDVARAYRGEYFYNAVRPDYRGRVYPMTTELSTVGNDLSRSILLFDKKKKLGTQGLRALKLHLASLYGQTKRSSFDERLDWVEENWANIMDSGEKGFSGKRWFLESDHRWQVRSVCHELYLAYQHPDGPEEFESGLPVHQDGSCNGLQHYAALARDVHGGSAVNLLPTDRPTDVYTQVLDLVIAKIEKDAEAGDPVALDILAMRDKVLVRNLVKRTVMTRVYGLTTEGAKRHVREFFEGVKLKRRSGDPYGVQHVEYQTRATLDCIKGLFPRATAIQDWLMMCCNLILRSVKYTSNESSKEGDIAMNWTSPLGFPVVQDIREHKSKQVATIVGHITLVDPDDELSVQVRKERDAFAPNYIHSLDATHLFRTALKCKAEGMTMSSVHDSFWTHAVDAEKLRDFTRSTFADQYYNVDLLEDLRNQLLAQYGDNVVKIGKVTYFKQRHEQKQLEEQLRSNETLQHHAERDAWLHWSQTITPKWSTRPTERTYAFIKDVLPPCPSKGDLNLQEVLKSEYFFH